MNKSRIIKETLKIKIRIHQTLNFTNLGGETIKEMSKVMKMKLARNSSSD